MSELFMECVEEELEPWQKPTPVIHLIDDDDDEPIFVGVLSNTQRDVKKTSPPPPPAPPPPQRNQQEVKQPAPPPAVGPSPIMLPLNIAGNAVNAVPPTLTTVTPQPVIVNNQGFIVTSPQLANNRDFIASLGAQYPPGTSFTIVPAGQQQIFQQVTTGTVIPGAVHRPQVQQISNNVVTLSNVQTPAVYAAQSSQMQLARPNLQSLQTVPLPIKINSVKGSNADQIPAKRVLTPKEAEGAAKRLKLDMCTAPPKIVLRMENGLVKKKCPSCQEEFHSDETLNYHMMKLCANVGGSSTINSDKRIMLVSDFYYGRFEGDVSKKEEQKTNYTFKCQSCLKILKNNIRFMNHMKHHLELEKQNSESWESHTTCQHCYRQYMTPFQLQCHIESAHSPIESSTNCKICELAFESEQVLLEHMKGNHKPGEMPYVCQVCNYRSSFFSDVETHFRTAHENTKDLLCPFCLKVLRTSHIYMQHYMKHQNKGIHRCGKCRLNFLTYKEKVEHRTHVHKTFRKPKALEGLPPGTKVTIRASLTGKANILPAAQDQVGPAVPPETPRSNHQSKAPYGTSKFKVNVSGGGKARTHQAKRREEGRNSKHNLALTTLSLKGRHHTCIECNTQVDNFFSHFPMVSNCGACKYRTSCKVSIGNHMIRFHSTITKNRFLKMDPKKHSSALKLTLACLNCDFLDASGGDLMTKHLNERPSHSCKVFQERDVKAKDQVLQSQPAKVQAVGVAPAGRLQETDTQEADSVVSESQTDPSGSNPQSSAGDKEKVATETAVTEESPVEENEPAPESTSSMSEPTEKGPEVCEELSNSEGSAANAELPVTAPEPSAEERQPEAD